jgi:CRISPR-associated protein Cst2
LTCEELDVFGYMNTSLGQTRKTPLHITKAISIFPYEQDMGMYANHDLVRRAKEQGTLDSSANPNPYNKEEHTSFYKITYTIDADKLGIDKWIVPIIEVDLKQNLIKIKNVVQKEEEKETVEITTIEPDKNNENKKVKKEKASKEEILRSIKILSKPNENENIFEVENGTIEFAQLPNKKYWVTFQLSKINKEKRIRDILNTIQNGLIAHSSSESNTIVPMFIIVGDVKVPSPIFHSLIDVKRNIEGVFELIGIKDCLRNGWLKGNIFMQDCERLKKPETLNHIMDPRIKENWGDFLEAVNLPEAPNNESPKN